MPKSVYFDDIEAYLTGQLSAAEKGAFEKRLTEDKELAQAFALQKLEHEAMEVIVERELRNAMTAWADNPPVSPFLEEKDLPREKGKIIPLKATNWRKYLWIAAGILVLFLTIFAIRQNSTGGGIPVDDFVHDDTTDSSQVPPLPPIDTVKEENSEEAPFVVTPDPPEPGNKKQPKPRPPQKDESSSYTLLAVATYADEGNELAPFSTIVRGGNLDTTKPTGEKSILLQAAEAFDTTNYATVLQLLGAPKPGDQSNKRYLRAHTYFRLKQYENAIPEFEYMVADEFRPHHEESRWYLLLSYLATYNKNKEKFDTLAQNLAAEGNEAAKALMQKLE